MCFSDPTAVSFWRGFLVTLLVLVLVALVIWGIVVAVRRWRGGNKESDKQCCSCGDSACDGKQCANKKKKGSGKKKCDDKKKGRRRHRDPHRRHRAPPKWTGPDVNWNGSNSNASASANGVEDSDPLPAALADQLADYEAVQCTVQAMSTEQQQQVRFGSRPHQQSVAAAGLEALTDVYSTNWAGYAAMTNVANPAKGSVTACTNTWTTPTLKSESGTTYVAFWAGIDGYSSPTVEQIGTLHMYTARVGQTNYAWFEMYPGGMYQLIGFSAAPGQLITGSVLYLGNNTFTLTIMNHTTQQYFVVPASYTKSATALRSSAEWIAEAPSSNAGVLSQANYGTASFSGCTATINGITGPINDPSWQAVNMTMVTPTGTVKSSTSALSANGESFTTTFYHT